MGTFPQGLQTDGLVSMELLVDNQGNSGCDAIPLVLRSSVLSHFHRWSWLLDQDIASIFASPTDSLVPESPLCL